MVWGAFVEVISGEMTVRLCRAFTVGKAVEQRGCAKFRAPDAGCSAAVIEVDADACR
jgi:hypothetical protein